MAGIDLKGLAGDPSSASNITDFQTKHIDLDWNLDFQAHRLSGHAEFTIERQSASITEAIFDASALEFHSVMDDKGTLLSYVYEPEGGKFGGRLVVSLPSNENKLLKIRVEYATTEGCKALQWLTPEQTSGKVHPYVFSQCQAILARTLLPCQDSPSVKSTYAARIRSSLPVVMSANVRQEQADGSLLFKQERPVPSYLIALAAGNLQSKAITKVSSVWAEPELLEQAAWEFDQVGVCLTAAESLCGPYRWGRYDLLILPPSFPFGGMENPCLTFLTPSLLAGDRSLVNVIAHEIAHSWTGNLVTNRSWVPILVI